MTKKLIVAVCVVAFLMSYGTGCWKKATPKVEVEEINEPEYLGTLFQVFGERIDARLCLRFVVKDDEGFLKRYKYTLHEEKFPRVRIIITPDQGDPVWILEGEKVVSISNSRGSLLK